jgi:hypothetical protein
MSTDRRMPHFAPISLEELNSTAALQIRRDRKYLIPQDDVLDLLRAVPDQTRILTMHGASGFDYDSVYFDTPGWESYLRTARRRRHRFKVRTRLYVDSGDTYLEVKTKDGRGHTVKDRVPYSGADLRSLTASARAYVGEALNDLGLDGATVHSLTPCLRSTYRRSTLLNPEGSRATIDTALSWSDPTTPDGAVVTLPGWAIVETKSSSAPSALDRALWRRGHRPSGISKFGVGLAALHPELPANKWHRIMTGPVAHTRTRSMIPAQPATSSPFTTTETRESEDRS